MPEKEPWFAELLGVNDEDVKMTDKQAKIVQAAVEIFSEKGYSATSTSEIAQKAGVAEGTIFRHYKTKKDLLLSIVTPIIGKLIAPVLMKDFGKVIDLPYSTYEDFLRTIIRNRMEFARTHMPMIKILLHEVPFQPEIRDHFKQLITEIVFSRVTRVVEHFQKQGQLIEMPPVTAIRLTVSTMVGFLLARFLLAPDYEWDDEKEIENTIQFILYGLTPR